MTCLNRTDSKSPLNITNSIQHRNTTHSRIFRKFSPPPGLCDIAMTCLYSTNAMRHLHVMSRTQQVIAIPRTLKYLGNPPPPGPYDIAMTCLNNTNAMSYLRVTNSTSHRNITNSRILSELSSDGPMSYSNDLSE